MTYLDRLANEQPTRTLQLLEAIADKLGVPHSAARDTQTRTLETTEALARRYGLLPPIPEPTMGTITKSIGTNSRDYSTITLWEADLDNATHYASGDEAVGECYDDSAFNETPTINGGGTIGLASVTLKAAVGEGHDGTKGTGVRLVAGANFTNQITVSKTNTTINQIEIDANGFQLGFLIRLSNITGENGVVSRCLLHGERRTSNLSTVIDLQDTQAARLQYALNNIIYDCQLTNSGAVALDGILGQRGSKVYNNTIHGLTRNTGSGTVTGLRFVNDDISNIAKNNVACATGGTTSGTKADLSPASPAASVMDHNASSDTTASGTGSLTSIVTADQFVSTVSGSEDLHLKAGADCIDAGTDLGTTPTGVNIDINGRDRDALNDVWDIGAHEYVSAGGITAAPWSYYAMMMEAPNRG